MVWLKFIMSMFWIMVIGCSLAMFIDNLFKGNIFWIRVSVAVMILAIPTLIAIIKEVK
jgi:hypothetical protein